MEPFKVFVLYSVWFIVVFVVAMLWFLAMVDIKDHMRRSIFRTTHLIFMAVGISVIAVGTLTSANAVVRHGWIDAPMTLTKQTTSASAGCKGFSYSFTYSFGLERPSRIPQECIEAGK